MFYLALALVTRALANIYLFLIIYTSMMYIYNALATRINYNTFEAFAPDGIRTRNLTVTPPSQYAKYDTE